ncbi:hypothetical protein HPT25_23310 [Bacillus sp. BRMEA1]|uniref:hypothetical protein n=1 Tax=Neobacillus endophyticus TaxID=2738405 RepID=UPI001566720B|nr:hypothetical protein [Neobacillus endophyticus]NRD80254.1 hypothetical protein [Neobacillus endophyticus]
MAIKSFSYKEGNEQHKKAVEYLEAQPNQSQFLINLLITAMEENHREDNLEDKIRTIVSEIVGQQRGARGGIRYIEKQT